MVVKEVKARKKLVVEEISGPVAEKPAEAKVEDATIDSSNESTQETLTEMPVEEPKLAVPTPPPAPITQPKFPIFWIIVPGLMLLVALVGGFFVYQKGVSQEKTTSAEPTSSPFVEPETTPTPEPKEINKAEFKIDIQNGSGIKGEAGKVKDLLEKAGLTVGSAGNAKTYDYKETVIQAKEGVSTEFLKELKTALEKSYVVKSKVDIIPDKEASEVIVIVGSSKT